MCSFKNSRNNNCAMPLKNVSEITVRIMWACSASKPCGFCIVACVRLDGGKANKYCAVCFCVDAEVSHSAALTHSPSLRCTRFACPSNAVAAAAAAAWEAGDLLSNLVFVFACVSVCVALLCVCPLTPEPWCTSTSGCGRFLDVLRE